MVIWNRLTTIYNRVDSIVQCAVLYVAAVILDDISSLHFLPGFTESNPFARHADGSFWLQHALITQGFNTLEALLVSAGCYVGARVLGEKYAKFTAGLPWLYYGWAHLDAAILNTLMEIPNLYVQTYQEMLKSLTGH